MITLSTLSILSNHQSYMLGAGLVPPYVVYHRQYITGSRQYIYRSIIASQICTSNCRKHGAYHNAARHSRTEKSRAVKLTPVQLYWNCVLDISECSGVYYTIYMYAALHTCTTSHSARFTYKSREIGG